MESSKVINFQSLTENVGKFHFGRKTVLIPEMNYIAAHLFVATLRGFGIDARVLETYKGLDLGKEYTSGKECYPCQITMGDILYFMKKEKETLGEAFHPENYVYFMPESDGPCRFGMYNKYQRIVLDSFPGLDRLKISSLTTKDGYSLAGIIEKEKVLDFRKAGYFSLVVADILDRLTWRVRPYERRPGMTNEFIETAMRRMERILERHAVLKEFDKVLDELEEVIQEAKGIIDPDIPSKPLVGIVGEIFLRMHKGANQDLIQVLERYGAEVVNASLAEWINYTSYDRLRETKIALRLSLKQFKLRAFKEHLRAILGFGGDLLYQELRQKHVYKRIGGLLDLRKDHKVGDLEKTLKEGDTFCFDVGTEACLSIAGILEYAKEGYDGVVNVYPFTCMPSTTTSAIIKPLMNELGVPYLDTPYDGSSQPGREAAIRTFMYQAHQHFERKGKRNRYSS